jgi:ADP-heptose:LPS heptosyltransferase/hemerythrin-like domain-containing protein
VTGPDAARRIDGPLATDPVALVLRALYLGDLLTGLPALRMLRSALPRHRIVLAAPAEVGWLARTAGTVDEVIAARELDPFANTPTNVDVAVDLHGNGVASRTLLEATGPRRLVAYFGGPHVWSSQEHEVDRWCRLVGEAFGIAPPWPGVRGTLPVPDAAVPRGVTVIHPGAKAAARRWPVDRYADLARRLIANGHDVVITGNDAEDELTRQAATGAQCQRVVGAPLRDLLALVAHARLVICGDTGIAHIASAYGTPSVVLFGPVAPALWGPPSDGPHRPLWHGSGTGDPHADQPDPALLAITVDEVEAAVTEVPVRFEPSGERVYGVTTHSRRRRPFMSSDAIVLLKDDHKKVKKLFRDFESAGDDDIERKGRLVNEILELLTVHTYLENECMYPEVRRLLPDLEDDVLESYEEHHVADVLCAELAAMQPDAERFDAKTTVLIESVRHHIEEEEQEWFPKVREGLGRKQLQELGARMTEMRKDAPRSPSQPGAVKKAIDAVVS